ncbi:hypothetical protein SESBI_26780 [Sesbania bispinosa]|nr:hypothetical protein SESBI_26780 [Sesbania bispinosa]
MEITVAPPQGAIEASCPPVFVAGTCDGASQRHPPRIKLKPHHISLLCQTQPSHAYYSGSCICS